jgi:hypothetical protein
MASKGYNPDKHSTLPYVDKPYKVLLDKLADKNGRNKKRQVEIAIETVATDEGVK